MKILHTADWHIGKKLNDFSRLPEQEEVLQEIVTIADAEQIDIILIAGDIFDTFNPSAEALDLFYKYAKKLTNNGQRVVIGIAGNHDMPERIDATDPLASACGIFLMGYPLGSFQNTTLENNISITNLEHGIIQIKLPQYQLPINIILTPYPSVNRLKTYISAENHESGIIEFVSKHWDNLSKNYFQENTINLLMSHLFMINFNTGEIHPEPEEEKSILNVGGTHAFYTNTLPQNCDYVALGHLHNKIEVQKEPFPVIYSSSPLCYSFAEAHQTKYVACVEFDEQKNRSLQFIPLKSGKPLSRKTFKSTPEAIEWLQNNLDHLVELTIQTENYLTSLERKEIYDTGQKGIITLIPQLKTNIEKTTEQNSKIEERLTIEEEFENYFQIQNNVPINDELKALFKEIKEKNIEANK